MKTIKISQTNERENWLESRRGVVTSTKATAVKPLSRGTSLPAGIYELLAEKVAIAKDGEIERSRGIRLENEALLQTQDKYGLDFEFDPGMWLSDDGKLGVSPDASEVSDEPTYAGEAKCLDTKNHLQAILNDWSSRQKPGYNPLDSLKFGTNDFTAQAIQYFVINENLETLFFTLFDDRVALANVTHYVIIIKRENVQEYVDGQELYERDALAKVDNMIKILKEIK